MKNDKLLNIEALRIFAIICTIMIHVSNVYFMSYANISNNYFFFAILFNSFSRICVPVFFMISGLLLIPKEEDFIKYKKRIIKFLITLIVWTIIYMLYNKTFSLNSIVKSFFDAEKSSRHLWYMYALLGLYLTLPFIRKMCMNMNEKEENLFIVLWCILSGLKVVYIPLAKTIISNSIDFSYPVPFVEETYYLGYFVLGHILYKRFKNYKDKKHINKYLILGYVLPSLITTLLTYYISIKTNKNFDAFFWYRSIFIIVSSASVFLFFIINKELFKSEKIYSFSKYTFGIYLIHYLFFKIIIDNFMYINYNSLYMCIPLVIIIYFVSLLTTFILKKIPFVKKVL